MERQSVRIESLPNEWHALAETCLTQSVNKSHIIVAEVEHREFQNEGVVFGTLAYL